MFSVRTSSASVLAVHVTVLVSLEEALGLGSRGRAARELLVESDNPLHARGISGTANGLQTCLSAFRRLFHSNMSSGFRVRSGCRGIQCAFGGSFGGSEENGRGLRSTYVGRSDLYRKSACFANNSLGQHTFGGTRVETMVAVFGYDGVGSLAVVARRR
jgi:hypothetical protein